MSFRDFFLILTPGSFCSVDWNCLGNFDRWPYEEYLGEISLNFVLAIQEQLFKDFFFYF